MARFALCVLLLVGLAATGFARDMLGEDNSLAEACVSNMVSFPLEEMGEAIACGLGEITPDTPCCAEVHEIFGSDNSCTCDATFFTVLLESFPEDFPVEDFLDGLEACGVAVRGSEGCGGGEEGPLVQQQVLLKKIVVGKVILAKALAVAAHLGRGD